VSPCRCSSTSVDNTDIIERRLNNNGPFHQRLILLQLHLWWMCANSPERVSKMAMVVFMNVEMIPKSEVSCA
jgi:hypothetical protein